ncbi:unnamed protein product [Polarella glacialis]|uniref:Cyclin n=1 Tax=Polarella glacialis TaxID=89957 RepID=A0A813HEU8_POLGL|nr:unnamed protein product [Polarella glacialis]|mmetsp:Transcript_26339/g.46637  ORF Transcript_26339/g.46637 Transcript_26339/m.46637 type:complete len:268 (-) Transcript_26339:166-969(-)
MQTMATMASCLTKTREELQHCADRRVRSNGRSQVRRSSSGRFKTGATIGSRVWAPKACTAEKAEAPSQASQEVAKADVVREVVIVDPISQVDWAPEEASSPTANGSLCSALASVYGSLAAMTSKQQSPQRLTRFHSKVEPAIGIHQYMQRVWQYFKCSDACHVMALIYIDRLVKLHPDFTVTNFTIHRLLAAATVIAAKYLDDVYYCNAYYAKVCGLSLLEMNALEANFVSLIRWKLNIERAEYDAYHSQVVKAVGSGAPVQEETGL